MVTTTRSRLAPAHRGYEYQDLLVAGRLVDMLLGSVIAAHCDEKLVADDRFDDLTTIDLDGARERVQFKHTGAGDRALTLDTFTSDGRSLKLDHLIASILADRAGPGRDADEAVYRVVLRDQLPTDTSLVAVLRPATQSTRPYLAGMRTERLRFDASALWQQRDADTGAPRPFAFLFGAGSSLTRDDLEWVCDRLVIEVASPPASLDLTDPGPAEHLLLARVRADVGAESFPNEQRTAVDVAAALLSSGRAARQGLLVPSTEELLRRADLRSDFGAVARAHPVDRAVEVERPAAVEELLDAAGECASVGRRVLIVGPPGHGKSWVCQQVMDVLGDEGWLVAEHYCYLGDADGERLERVLAESVLGSLLGRLAAGDPRVVSDQRPRFAADEDALVCALRRSRDLEPERNIALVVDGVDHITRVRAWPGRQSDPSKTMAETLAALELPAGVALIVLSQPGDHLTSLEEAGTSTIALPGLTRAEIQLLAGKLDLLPRAGAPADETSLLWSDEAVEAFIDALVERSGGNALYATYLCRETQRGLDNGIDAATVVRELPAFDGTLKDYYDHLYRSLDADAAWVADLVALADFAVTRADLRDIRPDAAHRVDRALEVLEPVLVERATQGGVRVYHESFARYLRAPFQDDAVARAALLRLITGWLETRGLFTDARAFHSLLPLLAEAGDDKRVVDNVDSGFITNAVASGFVASAIQANLAIAVGAAARLGDWPRIIRYVELSRAAGAYQDERYDDTLVSFADVPAALLGADTLADRLLDNDRTVMPARAGLQMCAAIDAIGATPPWRTYVDAYVRESESDNTHYGEKSDHAVALAWLRGQLRLAASDPSTEVPGPDDGPISRRDLASRVMWDRVAEWVDGKAQRARDAIPIVLDTVGWEGVVALVDALPNPAEACLAAAEASATDPDTSLGSKSSRQWAEEAMAHGAPTGSVPRLLALGVGAADLGPHDSRGLRDTLLELTREVQISGSRMEHDSIDAWFDACARAAHLDQLGLDAAEASITGEGWYPCWLRFAIGLSRAHAASPSERGRVAFEALQLLSGDLRPFAGDPRACDLYFLHETIAATIADAMGMLDGDQWRSALTGLSEVSDSISTTMSGELGGPVPTDLVLRLAVDGATPARRDAAEALLTEEIARGSGGRFYSDLAAYRLLGARLALTAQDRERAEALWREACVFLTAYGWHKDITVYELLDPFPQLIQSEPREARRRLPGLQAVCERVPLHTDGRETRGARPRWWNLLAQADPEGCIGITVPALLAECNDPNWLLNEALESVWRAWHEEADPLIAGALRLTLDTPLELGDASQLERLAAGATDPATRRLLVWLLARADERPVAYGFSNGAELLARDDEKIAAINDIAERENLPLVVALRDDRSPPDDDRAPGRRPDAPVQADVIPGFGPGMPGLMKAIRMWRSRPYDTEAADWDPGRFANVIGYRLMDLVAEGKSEDATRALASFTTGYGSDRRTGILRSLAEGLERHGQPQLAARAYALNWTLTRGRGGWLTFGGETEIDSLHRATELDAETARTVIAEEIEHHVGGAGTGSYGISEAVIHALAIGALRPATGSSISTAFAAWDEAFDVIDYRTPWVDASDNPDVPYAAPNPDDGASAPGDLDVALALAAVGGLAHASREKKRRALLATELLLQERPAQIAPAIATALTAISDAATLTWLLGLLDAQAALAGPVVDACQASLKELATRDHLTVRAFARRMITSDPPALPPSASVRRSPASAELWTPEREDDGREANPGSDDQLDAIAGRRIARGARLLPDLASDVRRAAESALTDARTTRRLSQQLEAWTSRGEERWPDAFVAPNEAIEESLQAVAAGGRAALILRGLPIPDPPRWEDALASAIADDPRPPLGLEALRQPRPDLPPPPRRGDTLWMQIREPARGAADATAEEVEEADGLLVATLRLETASSLPAAHQGPYRDWHWLGTAERRVCKHPEWREKRDLVAERYRVVEVRDPGDRQAIATPPVAEGDVRFWRREVDPIKTPPIADRSQPLVGIDYDAQAFGDAREGLGVPGSLLVPLPSLVGALGLRPGDSFTFEDGDGVALALVTWRAEYDVSDYYLAWPRTHGSGILVRPDLLARLVASAGPRRLVVRDFILGSSELASE